jgi:hypothetical protein
MINFMDKSYYTYAYLRRDGTPYYVGRGKGRRAFSKDHNVHVPPRDRILFLKRELTFSESVKHEIYMISVLGRKDTGTGVLRNLTNGGDGAPGSRKSPETRKKQSLGVRRAWAEGRHHDITGDNNPNIDGHHGEKNGRAKLTDSDRRNIVLEYVPGRKYGHRGNCAELAERYGVGMSQIRRIAGDPRWTS